MKWILLAAALWLIGAATPWGREEYTFKERLGQPMSLAAGVFAVAALVPIIGAILFVVGMVLDTLFF